MKKYLCLILAAVLAVSLLGCVTSEPAPAGTQAGSQGADATQATESANTDLTEVDFEEVVVVDNEYCAIKITGIEDDSLWGYTLKTVLENKSAETTYMFAVDSASVNAVEADPIFADEVAPGKKANAEISFSDDELADIIGAYTDIMLKFRVYDSDDWMADPVAETTTHIYPYGEANAAKYVREQQQTDTVIFDNAYVTAIVTGYTNDDLWGYSAKLYLVNKTDASVMFTVEDVSVNGFMCDPLFATTVGAGNCAFSEISWFDSTFEENGITDVESIELTMRAYDSEDWLGDDFANETVTLNP